MKFTMNGVEYTIWETNQKEYKQYKLDEDRDTQQKETDISIGIYFGASHYYQNVIFLDEALPLDRKKKTLYHELTHCYIGEYITHEDKTFDEEMVADISANSHDIIHKIVEDYFKNYTLDKNEEK